MPLMPPLTCVRYVGPERKAVLKMNEEWRKAYREKLGALAKKKQGVTASGSIGKCAAWVILREGNGYQERRFNFRTTPSRELLGKAAPATSFNDMAVSPT